VESHAAEIVRLKIFKFRSDIILKFVVKGACFWIFSWKQVLLILNEGITGSQYKIMNDLGDIQNILAQLLLEQMKIF